MSQFASIEKRYGIRIPDLYRTLHDAGHFDPDAGDNYLAFTDNEWLSPDEIAEYEFLEWQAPHKTWFVPFSISARRDEWGWRLDWITDGEPAVVFCERGPEGFGYAPHFQGFLYRKTLEELSGTWLMESTDDAQGLARVKRTVEIVTPHLPAHWAERITELSQREWTTDELEAICVFPRSECEAIAAAELAFPHLDEEFLQEAE